MRNFMRFQFFLWYLLFSFGMILVSDFPGASAETEGYDAHGQRDPFVPLVTSTMKASSSGLLGIESIENLIIEGIVYDPKHGSVVIVNGAILKEGEMMGNVKVLQIKPDGATFSVNGTEGFKPMYQEDSKTTKLT